MGGDTGQSGPPREASRKEPHKPGWRASHRARQGGRQAAGTSPLAQLAGEIGQGVGAV